MRHFLTFLLICTALSADPFAENPRIAIQNSILARVNGTTISMMDVKKKMDMTFYQHYAQFANSTQARYQFYETNWRRVLMEMIDHELILADASDKEVKLADAEVREEIENRFGPNVMSTLNEIGIPYEEAWKMIKDEMIVMRMNWWFIHSKALATVTPQAIRQNYRLYLQENPARTEWRYRVLTLRGGDEVMANELYQHIQTQIIDQIASENRNYEDKSDIYPNKLKSWEFDKEASRNLGSERAIIVERQGTSENTNSEAKPTQSKTNFSNCLGIEAIPELLKQFEQSHSACSVTLSNEYTATDATLAESHRTSLAGMEPNCFSPPVSQVSRDRQKVTRIFYLAEKTAIPAPTFEQMSSQIKNELMQKKSMEMSTVYLNKLRKHYRFDLPEMLSSDLQPFSLQ